MLVTAKTHKPKFKFRATHAQAKSNFLPAAKRLGEKRKAVTRGIPLILKDSGLLKQQLLHRK